MLVVDVLGCVTLYRSVCELDLEVYGTERWFCLVGVPSEPPTRLGFPPLNPVVGSRSADVEFDAKPRFQGRVLPLEKCRGTHLGDDFVGVSPGGLVPDGVTPPGSRETVVDPSKEFRLDWPPHTEYWAHERSPGTLETNVVGDAVGE